MITSAADLACINDDGSLVYPTGPCSAWPKERNSPPVDFPSEEEVRAMIKNKDPRVKASLGNMAKGFVETTVKLVKNGTLSQSERDARYNKCLQCPSFIRSSKRCSECGCFMEAKTWISGAVCPLAKW